MIIRRLRGVLSKCVSSAMNVRTYSTWRMSVLLRLLCTAFYIYMSTGMPEYSADLNIDDVIYINCYMHVWSNYSNTSVERAYTRWPQLTNCYILLCNWRDYQRSLSLRRLRSRFELSRLLYDIRIVSNGSTDTCNSTLASRIYRRPKFVNIGP